MGRDDSTRVLEGAYAFSELVSWQEAISASVRVPGFLAIDADEARNRVRVVVGLDASLPNVMRAIEAAGVPAQAVIIERRRQDQAAVSLRDRYRPTAGGLQIVNAGGGRCTLGFNVDVQFYNEKGFLTAGHCASGSPGSGQTGGLIYQNTVQTSNLIGTISLNPAWSSTDPNCAGYTLCTMADVMFVTSANSSSTEWAKRVAWTTSTGTNNARGSLTISGWSSGLQSYPFIYQGALVYKVGRTTGQTLGAVSATCENPVVTDASGLQYVALCSVRVNGAAVGGGDSGAPVYYPQSGGDPPYAIGILFAGGGSSIADDFADATWYCTAGCTYVFSEWYQVQSHLSRYLAP